MDISEKIIKPAIEEIQATIKHKSNLQFSDDLPLVGQSSPFDSIALVSIIVLIEENILNVTGKSISLTDEKVFSNSKSPFQNVKTLSLFIEEKLKLC